MPKLLSDIFQANESPYFGMYTAGRNGYSLAETVNYVRMLGILMISVLILNQNIFKEVLWDLTLVLHLKNN